MSDRDNAMPESNDNDPGFDQNAERRAETAEAITERAIEEALLRSMENPVPITQPDPQEVEDALRAKSPYYGAIFDAYKAFKALTDAAKKKPNTLQQLLLVRLQAELTMFMHYQTRRYQSRKPVVVEDTPDTNDAPPSPDRLN